MNDRFGFTFARLREINVLRCESHKPQGFGHPLKSWDMMQWACATAGEIGEACNKAKKLGRYALNNQHMNKTGEDEQNLLISMADEVGDGIIYADLWLASAGFATEDILQRVFNRKSREMHSSLFL